MLFVMFCKSCSSQIEKYSFSAETNVKIGLTILLISTLAIALLGFHDALSSPASRIWVISRPMAIARACVSLGFAAVALTGLIYCCRGQEKGVVDPQKVETLRKELNDAFIEHGMTIDYFGGVTFIERLCKEAQSLGRYRLKFDHIFIGFLKKGLSGNWFGNGDGKYCRSSIVSRLGAKYGVGDGRVFDPAIASNSIIIIVKTPEMKVFEDEFFSGYLKAGGTMHEILDRNSFSFTHDPIAREIIKCITYPKA